MANFEFKKTIDNFMSMKKAINFLKDNEVFVGIPEEENTRKENGEQVAITNADLLFIHTNGSPINNIPPRPVIEPAIADAKERISSGMKKAGQLAFEKREDEAFAELQKVGMRGQNVSRAWFTNPKNGWPPNSPSVANAKRKKGATDPKPLIDTGELRKSITYFVSKKGRRVK